MEEDSGHQDPFILTLLLLLRGQMQSQQQSYDMPSCPVSRIQHESHPDPFDFMLSCTNVMLSHRVAVTSHSAAGGRLWLPSDEFLAC